MPGPWRAALGEDRLGGILGEPRRHRPGPSAERQESSSACFRLEGLTRRESRVRGHTGRRI